MEQPLDPADMSEIDTGAKAVFPVQAGDLMPERTGPELGRHLAELEGHWIASGFVLSKSELLK